jgi:hypothetical protein
MELYLNSTIFIQTVVLNQELNFVFYTYYSKTFYFHMPDIH